MTVLLRLEELQVSYGDKTVLQGVHLSLPPSGLTSLLGPSGSGKSTLLRTIAGLNEANPHVTTRGTAELLGRELRSIPPERAGEVRPGVGLVVQHAKFFVDTVRENLLSALPNRARLSRSAQMQLVLAHLQRTGLGALAARLDDDVVSLPKALQRRLAVALAMLPEPALLMADEPIAGLDDSDSVEVAALLRRYARTRAVLFVTHNQRFARAIGGSVALLAEGRIQETGPAASFFASPSTACGQRFVETGGYARPAPSPGEVDGTESVSDVESRPPAARLAGPGALRPRRPKGFIWLVPNRLGGTPRPGLLEDLDDDLDGLSLLGVTTLATLEETATIPREALERRQIRSVHFPIVDMGAPSLDDAARFVAATRDRIANGEIVAIHCRAGLGRTGTMLACHLIAEGDAACRAIVRIRSLNPLWIQSQAQLDFLRAFEAHLSSARSEHHAVDVTKENP